MELVPFVIQNWIYFAGAAVLIVLIIANEINLRRAKGFSLDVVKTLQETNNETAIVIDIRKQEEYQKGHIPTALNIPSNTIEKKLSNFEKYEGKKLILYASDDARANQICIQLRKEHDTKTIYTLAGGLNAWVDANLPLAKGKK